MIKTKLTKINIRPLLIPTIIFLIGLLLRLFYVHTLKNDAILTSPILDAQYYSDWAQHIAKGESFTESAFFVEPGYAYLLAFSYKLFGVTTWPIIYLQFILGALTPVIIYLCANKLWQSSLPKTIVAIAGIFFGPFVFYDALLLKTTAEVFGMSLVACIIIYTWEKPLFWYRFALGMIIGLTALFKANVLYSLPFLALAIILPKPRAAKTIAINVAALLIGAFIAIFPATIHNWQKSHSFVPINYSGGPNLYIGNWEGADGSLKPPEFISVDPKTEETSWRKMTEAYLHHKPAPSEISSFWTGRATSEILANPVKTTELLFKKILLFFNATPLDDNYDIGYGKDFFSPLKFLLPFWPIAIFGLLGVFVTIRSGRKLYFPLYAILASYFLTIIASHVAERYRLALFPILLLFAGYLFLWFKEIIERRDFAKLTGSIVALLVLTLIAFLPFRSITRTTTVDMHNNFGANYEKSGDLVNAKKQFEKSLITDQDYVPAIRNLARIALREGNVDEAIEGYRNALQIQYDLSTDELKIALDLKEKNLSKDEIDRLIEDSKEKTSGQTIYDADYIEGMRFFRKHQYTKAAEKFEKAYRRNNTSEAIMTNLATAYKNSKEPGKAQQFFEKALTLNDYNLPAHYNLGNLFSAKKSYAKAITQYERINEIVPGFQLSRYYLAQTYAENKDMQKSLDIYRQFVEEAKNDPTKTQQVSEAKMIIEKASPKVFK